MSFCPPSQTTLVEKAVVSDDDTYLPNDFSIGQDVLTAYLQAVQDIHSDFIDRESVLEIGHESDLSHFVDFYTLA